MEKSPRSPRPGYPVRSTQATLTRTSDVKKDLSWALRLKEIAGGRTLQRKDEMPRLRALIENGVIPDGARALGELIGNLMACRDTRLLRVLLTNLPISKLSFVGAHRAWPESSWQTLKDALPHACVIEELELHELHLGFPACSQLLKCLDKMPMLTRLSLLEVNTFPTRPLQRLPGERPHLPQLKVLNAYGYMGPLLGRIMKHAQPDQVKLCIRGDDNNRRTHAHLCKKFMAYGGPSLLEITAEERCLLEYGPLLKRSTTLCELKLSAPRSLLRPPLNVGLLGPLMNALDGNTSLKKLSLANCSLLVHWGQGKRLGMLVNHSGLCELDLSQNPHIDSEAMVEFFSALSPDAPLRRLDLGQIFLGVAGFDAMTAWLQNNKTLVQLRIAKAPKNVEKVADFVGAVQAHPGLRKLRCDIRDPELANAIRRNRARWRSEREAFVFGGVRVVMDHFSETQNLWSLPAEVSRLIASFADSDEAAKSLATVSTEVQQAGANAVQEQRDRNNQPPE